MHESSCKIQSMQTCPRCINDSVYRKKSPKTVFLFIYLEATESECLAGDFFRFDDKCVQTSVYCDFFEDAMDGSDEFCGKFIQYGLKQNMRVRNIHHANTLIYIWPPKLHLYAASYEKALNKAFYFRFFGAFVAFKGSNYSVLILLHCSKRCVVLRP